MRKKSQPVVLDAKLPSKRPNKYFEIARTLKGRILSGELAYRLPTIAELANEFGVTLVTMQKAMGLLKADGCINAIPGRGSFVTRLKRNRTHVLGALLNGRGTLATRAGVGMQRKAQERHEGIVLVHYDVGPHDPLEELKKIVTLQKVDGVVLLPHMETTSMVLTDYLKSEEIPFVVVALGRTVKYEGCTTITTWDEGAATDLMAHLIGAGHRAILFAHDSPMDDGTHAAIRYQQYARCMREAHLPKTGILDLRQFDPESRANVADVARRLRDADAVFCDTDGVALGVLRVCLASGITVPGDLAVASFDNTDAAKSLGLTSVEQHFDQIGAKAVDLLLDEIEGDRVEPVHLDFETDLVVRSSSGRGDSPAR